MNRDFGGDYFLGDLINSYSLGLRMHVVLSLRDLRILCAAKVQLLVFGASFSSAQSRRDEMNSTNITQLLSALVAALPRCASAMNALPYHHRNRSENIFPRPRMPAGSKARFNAAISRRCSSP